MKLFYYIQKQFNSSRGYYMHTFTANNTSKRDFKHKSKLSDEKCSKPE